MDGNVGLGPQQQNSHPSQFQMADMMTVFLFEFLFQGYLRMWAILQERHPLLFCHPVKWRDTPQLDRRHFCKLQALQHFSTSCKHRFMIWASKYEKGRWYITAWSCLLTEGSANGSFWEAQTAPLPFSVWFSNTWKTKLRSQTGGSCEQQ